MILVEKISLYKNKHKSCRKEKIGNMTVNMEIVRRKIKDKYVS